MVLGIFRRIRPIDDDAEKEGDRVTAKTLRSPSGKARAHAAEVIGFSKNNEQDIFQ